MSIFVPGNSPTEALPLPWRVSQFGVELIISSAPGFPPAQVTPRFWYVVIHLGTAPGLAPGGSHPRPAIYPEAGDGQRRRRDGK